MTGITTLIVLLAVIVFGTIFIIVFVGLSKIFGQKEKRFTKNILTSFYRKKKHTTVFALQKNWRPIANT